MEIIGIAAILFGLFFLVVGVIGVLRLPDAYTRLHASGKVAITGLFGLLLGAAILMPSVTLRVIALSLFMILSAPVTSHAIAAAKQRSKTALDQAETRSPGTTQEYEQVVN